MTVPTPATGMEVDLDIADLRRAVAKLDNGLEEVRSGGVIPETGMKNAQLFAVQGLQFITSQTLVLPEALQKPFRGCIGGFTQSFRGGGIFAPVAVSWLESRGHVARCFSRSAAAKSSSTCDVVKMNERQSFFVFWCAMKLSEPLSFLNWVKWSFAALLLAGIPTARGAAAPAAPSEDSRRDATVVAIEKIMPSVVNIATATVMEESGGYQLYWHEFFGPYYQRRKPETRYSRGSGVIIDESGYVLTNDHVVRGANKIWVKLNDESEPLEAEVIALTSKSDLALLKMKTKPGQKFTAAKFASDDDILLGETVLALGNPFGLGGSVSRGIISSKSRRPPQEDEQLDIQDWLQTDAAINPGNSGGPLINLRGEVVGINVAVLKVAQGIGFAIPIKRVSEALSEIFTPELESLWFGARIRAGTRPLVVTAVQKDSPAAKAGLKAGDTILAINDEPPRNFIELNRALIASGDKQDVRLLVQSEGGGARPVNLRLVAEEKFFTAALIHERMGASVQQLNQELAENLGVGTTDGLIIAGVDKGSPAEKAELQRRLIIRGIDGQPTPTVVAAAKYLHGKAAGSTVTLNLLSERIVGNYIQRRSAAVEVKLR